MSTLGGVVCIRNGNELDFCWREAIESLLPVCDEVVVCDGESTDGTQEQIRDWVKREPKLKLCVYPWPDPKGDIDFWVNWLNYAREHLTTQWHFQLDADEILSEKSYDEIRMFINRWERRTANCTRWNFWKDHRHLIPEGHCLGKQVIRLAPADMWLPSDGCHENGNEAVSLKIDTHIQIFHYGFLRKRDKFFKKEQLLQTYFFDYYDPRLKDAESRDKWMEEIKGVDWIKYLEPYDGEHPKVIHQWLRDRGYEPLCNSTTLNTPLNQASADTCSDSTVKALE